MSIEHSFIGKAIVNGHEENFFALISNIDVNLQDDNKSLLTLALLHKQFSMADALVKAGATLNYHNSKNAPITIIVAKTIQTQQDAEMFKTWFKYHNVNLSEKYSEYGLNYTFNNIIYDNLNKHSKTKLIL